MKKKIFAALVAAFALGFSAAVAFLHRSLHTTGAEPVPAQAQHSQPPVSSNRKPQTALAELNSRSPEASLEPKGDAGPNPTPEERAVLSELSRRAQAGEFILGKENPFIVRMRREDLQRSMETRLPSVLAVRQEFLSTLNAAPEAISRLTNHAARIAEASWTAIPLLNEISVAKIEYDARARELLTPEQYEQFKAFETREVLEKEWGRAGVENLENLSATDLKGITQSLEELGIRDKISQSTLPYSSEPASGNWITAADSDLEQIMLARIGRMDAASTDFESIAERNQLSDAARKALGSMILSRGNRLRNQLDNARKPDEQRRAFGPPRPSQLR